MARTSTTSPGCIAAEALANLGAVNFTFTFTRKRFYTTWTLGPIVDLLSPSPVARLRR